MRRSLLSVVALAPAILIGCGRTDPVSLSIMASVGRGPGTRLVLADHARFAWERVCIWGPYTPNEEIDRISGIPGAASRGFDISENEGIDVLMFINRQQVVRSIAHGRRGADFGTEVVGRCYMREQAVFSIRAPSTSWGEIGPLTPG